MKKLLLFSLFFLSTLSLFSQTITVTYNSLYYTNEGASQNNAGNCGYLNMKLSNTTTVSANIFIQKPNNLITGNSKLRIFRKYNNDAGEQIVKDVNVFESDWNTGAQNSNTVKTVDFTITSTDFDFSGGKLYATFINQSGARYDSSCKYSVTKEKNPTFTLIPQSISLPCGDLSEKMFQVNLSNASSGTITYNWNAVGWRRNGVNVTTFTTSENSIILTPSSPSSLPSTVSVTPVINGVSQSTRTCSISRSPIGETAQISGPAQVCDNALYSISGLSPNQSVTWTVSEPSWCTLSASSGNTTTLTRIGNGYVTLTAKISNLCGQSYMKSFNIYLGIPLPVELLSASGIPTPNNPEIPTDCDGNTAWIFKAEADQKVTEVKITFLNASNVEQIIYKQVNSYGFFTVTGQDLGMTEASYRTLRIFPKNACGFAPKGKKFDIYKPTKCQCGIGPGCTVGRMAYLPEEQNSESLNQNIEGISMYPNPTSDIININLSTEILSSNPKVSIYNILGQQKRSINITESETSINVEDLQTGFYILKIDYNGVSETRKILKQ